MAPPGPKDSFYSLRSAARAPGQTVVDSEELAELLRAHDLQRMVDAANSKWAVDQAKRHAGMKRALLL